MIGIEKSVVVIENTVESDLAGSHRSRPIVAVTKIVETISLVDAADGWKVASEVPFIMPISEKGKGEDVQNSYRRKNEKDRTVGMQTGPPIRLHREQVCFVLFVCDQVLIVNASLIISQ